MATRLILKLVERYTRLSDDDKRALEQISAGCSPSYRSAPGHPLGGR